MTTELVELADCPFCGGAVMFRKALFVSDGCTDAIIHAAPTNCGLTDFTTYTTDESVITTWNTRVLASRAGVPDGFVLVRQEAIDWLNGESDFECPPDRYFRGEPPRYWWRSVFREKAGIAAAPEPVAVGSALAPGCGDGVGGE